MSRAYVDWQERLLQRDSARRHAINYGMGRREYPIQSMAHRDYTARQERRRERPRMVFNTTPRGGGSFYDEFIRMEIARMADDTIREEIEEALVPPERLRYAEPHEELTVEALQEMQDTLRNNGAVPAGGIVLPEGITPDDALDALMGRPTQVERVAPPTAQPEEEGVVADVNRATFDFRPRDVTIEDTNPEEEPELVGTFDPARTRRRPRPTRTGRTRNTTLNWGNAFRRDDQDIREIHFIEVLERANELTILAGEDGIYYATWQTHTGVYGSADDTVLNTLFNKVLEGVEKGISEAALEDDMLIDMED